MSIRKRLKAIKFSGFAIASLLLSAFSAYPQSVSVPSEVYGELPEKSLIAISPSANRMAYRTTSKDRDLLVAVDMVEGKLLQAASIENINPNNIYFVSENIVIFVATKNVRIGGYRGRHDSSWAYAFNIETGKIHALLEQDYGIYKGQTRLGRILGISKDKKYAFMPAYENPGSYNLYRVSLEKRRKPRIHQKGSGDTVDFFVGNDGEVLARERYNNKSDLHRIEARHDDDWVEIYREVTDIRTKGFNGLTPDKKSLVFRTYNSDGRRAYYTMSLKDGAISEPIFIHDKMDVSGLLTDLTRTVYGVSYSGMTPAYEFFDPKLNARIKGINKALPNNWFSIRDYTPSWDNIVFYMDGELSSGDYILYSKGEISMLAQRRPKIPPEAVHAVVETEFKARDGITIPTLLTMPNGKEPTNLPTIIMPHGGPKSHDTKGFNYFAQFFASKGYLVVQPQFRGSTGFGLDFIRAGNGEWGRKMQDDLTDSVTTLAKEGLVDDERVCIVGSSYGGYAALAGATFTPDLYKCVVSINGVSDISEMMESERRDYGSDHWVISYWEKAIANGKFDDDHLDQISPINHVKNVKAPILLIHGQFDEVVPVGQSREMADELEDEDKDVTLIELKGGNHHLSKAENRMKAIKAIETFVEKHI